MIKIKIAIEVIKKLKENGYDAYIVGGAVRDYLLGINANDIDITTSATPDEVSKIFKTYPSGLKFGSVTISYKKRKYEVTTFREDFDYLDSRRPSKIKYAKTPEEDAKRRDFTINALMLDENLKIYDFVGGISDLKNKVIKAVGDPNVRFNEDALRIFRAFYFVSKLGFMIEDKTFLAICNNLDKIKNIASERILQELRKMSKGKNLDIAISYIIKSNISMPSFIDFFKYMDKNKIYFESDIFFIGAYIKNNDIVKDYKFSNSEVREFNVYNDLIKNKTPISSYLIYKYGINRVILYNRLLDKFKYYDLFMPIDLLRELDYNLVVRNRKDINITNNEIIDHFNIKAGPWIKRIEEKITKDILYGRCKNTKEDILRNLKGDNDEI